MADAILNETAASPGRVGALLAALRRGVSGDVRSDALHRALYATDASIYQIVPEAVVFPKSVGDVRAAVRACADHGVPITARGAGTGLAGGAVNRGVQLDCSRHLNRIVSIDPDARTATVEPGVVLDNLNAAAAPFGLHFAPDVATSSRATIGGMIANNSCGAHSVLYGRTVDHLLAVDIVLADGSRCRWGEGVEPGASSEFGRRCVAALRTVATDYADEITARYPTILRRSGGYALDLLRVTGDRINAEAVICGSEGTLAIVVGATLRLTPLPKHKALVVAHFDDLLESLDAAPGILEHQPAAVELIDRMIIDAARAGPAAGRDLPVIEGSPEAVLIIELFDEDAHSLNDRIQTLAADLRARGAGHHWPVVTDPAAQTAVWNLRTSGLGLLMSRPGDRQPYAFVEDSAVDPTRLRDYIKRFQRILADEGVDEAGYYAHASVGCLHVRPVLNLKRLHDVQRMRRIADRVSSLALEFGGTMTGEHGDGIVRSCWLEKMYGPRIIEAFRTVKQAFDPQGILNPGKIVDPLPMTENLRFNPRAAVGEPDATALDFSTHGGMAGLANMCSGVGQCRQTLVGTMCPSFVATGDEMHTTRARANALRIAMSDARLIDGLDDPVLDEVMDLCLSCKACKTECPTGVDMGRLKSEWLWQRSRRRGMPISSRIVAHSHTLAEFVGRAPALANALAQSQAMRWFAERFLGFDRRVPPPRFASRSFRDWHRMQAAAVDRGDNPRQPSDAARVGSLGPAGGHTGRDSRTVLLFIDTWTHHFTPRVGIAAVRVLESLGYEVVIPPTTCCGRPAISKGALDVARELVERNVGVLNDHASQGLPIITLEPSCLSALVDEWPQLVRSSAARTVSERAIGIESFLASHLQRQDSSLPLVASATSAPVLYHGHCHQKALFGTSDAVKLLDDATGGHATEINSGCCGMAGSFGHETGHYDVARAVGEHRLFPAVRDRNGAEIAVSGFSCRHQIRHHTDAAPRHVIEIVAESMGLSCDG